MTNKNKLAYVTYQSFPAETANSLQSITNIVELAKQGIDVELVFPKRENTCSDDIEKLKNFYNFETSFKVTMLKHNLPFKKVAIFENPNSGGIMLCRTTFSSITKGASDSITVTWNVTIA